jgi:type I restriction enzyme, S subunit
MNPAQLLEHFDRISDAPDAVARLRRFILDLAVRSKLVEQDPNDEPAADLLERIQEEKARLVKEGNARKEKSRVPLSADKLPFPLPVGWQWSQLAEIGLVSPRNDVDGATLVSFVPMTFIPADYGIPHKHEVRPWCEIKTGYTHFAEGDVGLAKITPCFENGKSTVFRGLTGGLGAGTTELHVVRPLLVDADYVLLFLKCPHFIDSGIPRMTGTAGQKRVPADYFAYSPFPLPPLAEQHRIVAKVDELMVLCDQLEAAKNGREERRDRLVAASLHRIGTGPAATGAQSATPWRDAARFHLDYLPRLTTRPEHIKQLRQTILNLAVQGRLVPQNPNDEPAAELLERIQAGKDEKLLKRKKVSPVNQDVLPFALPDSWQWTRTESVCEVIVDCPHSTPIFVQNGVVCLDTNSFKGGTVLQHKIRYVSEESYRERIKRLVPQPGDIVFAREGSVGESVIVPNGMRCCLGQRVMLFRPMVGILPAYFQLALSSPGSLARLLGLHKGIGAKHVNVADMRNMLLALPPLAEQRRIVAKVDELMALCDQLEAQLISTQENSRRLLEAVLHEALAPAMEQAA